MGRVYLNVGWCPGLSKKKKITSIDLPLLPDSRHDVTSCHMLLLPWLPHHEGPHLQTVSQHQPLLPSVALTRWSVRAEREAVNSPMKVAVILQLRKVTPRSYILQVVRHGFDLGHLDLLLQSMFLF